MQTTDQNRVDSLRECPSFGEVLKKLRGSRCLTILALAQLANISVGSLSNYENNVQLPRPKALARLASVLEVPYDLLRWFVSRQEGVAGPVLESLAAVDRLMLTELALYAEVACAH